MDPNEKKLCAHVVETYLIEFQKGLKNLNSVFFENPILREKLNREIFSFINQHFHNFLQTYFKILSKDSCIASQSEITTDTPKISFRRKLQSNIKTLFSMDVHKKEATSQQIDFLGAFSSINKKQISAIATLMLEQEEQQFENSLKAATSFNEIKGKKCVFVSHLFGTTWHPTVKALQRKNWSVACLLQHDVKKETNTSYGCLATSEIKSNQNYILNFIGTIIFVLKSENSPMLFSGENYHHVNWDSVNAVFMFLNLSVILKTVRILRGSEKNNLILLMYDGLKPLVEFNASVNNDLSKFYRNLMSCADKIIYNSNAERFGEFVENTYRITAPRIHFYRYSEELSSNKKARLSFGKNNDEFHVVSITSFCNRNICAARRETYKAVLSMLEQSIHFHYYTCDDKEDLKWFISLIQRPFRKFFHIHSIQLDQQILVDELHQYHAGFNGSDYGALVQRAMGSLKDERYRTGMLNFMLSTFGTSFHVYVAAGVPPILPGMCTDSQKYYENFNISMNLSDFGNAKEFFKKINLQKMCSQYDKYCRKASANQNIHKLITFLEEKSSVKDSKSEANGHLFFRRALK